MNKYRRLSKKDRDKIAIYKKSKKIARKSLKWWVIVLIIVVAFVAGMVAFLKLLDSKSSQASQASQASGSGVILDTSKTDDNLNEMSKKELERESQKGATLQTQGDTDVAEESYDFSSWNKTCNPEMIVINKDNLMSETEMPKTKMCHGKEVALIACADLENMISNAKKQSITLWISSGYRDNNLQTKLFNRQVEREKSKSVVSEQEAQTRAAKVVARPRTSEHGTGLAIDFNGVEDNFYTTKEYKWLMDNAHKYGFIERYQKKWGSCTGVIYEPWHFRYVGKDNAAKIKESGLCLEQYVQKNLIVK